MKSNPQVGCSSSARRRAVFLTCLALLALTLPAAAQDISTNLIACYPLDGNGYDATSGGHDGVVANAIPTGDRFGNPDHAFYFSTDLDSISLAGSFGGGPEFTAAAWFYCDNPSTNYQAIISPNDDGELVQLQLNTFGNITVHVQTATGPQTILLPVQSPTPYLVWRHIAVSVRSGLTTLYVNGLPVATSLMTFQSVIPTSNLKIGAGVASGNLRHFRGAIDDVRLYNRALTGTDIYALYNYTGSCIQMDLSAGLLACFPFNGNANDESGKGHNGTVLGAALTSDRYGNGNSAYAFTGLPSTGISTGSWDLPNAFSVSAFINPDNAHPSPGAIVAKFDDATGNFCSMICQYHQGYAEILVSSSGAPPTQVLSLPVPPAQWSHVVFTYNGSNLMQIHLNGSLATQRFDISTLGVFKSTREIFIGRMTNTGLPSMGAFQGRIDDIRIYSRVLSAFEVVALYNDNTCATPVSIADGNAPVVLCAGDSVRLDASGGLPHYRWWPTGDTTQSIMIRTGGMYIIRGFNAICGCEVRDTAWVVIRPVIHAVAGPDKAICQGAAVPLSGSVSGGAPPYRRRWSPPDGLSSDTVLTPIASPAATTDYILTIEDANGCLAADTVRVTVNPRPSTALTLDADTVFCEGGGLRITVDSSSGCSFRWLRNGIPLGAPDAASVVVMQSGSYRVIVTNATPCSDTSVAVQVVVHPLPVPVIGITGDSVLCIGGRTTFTAMPAGLTCRWSRNGNPIDGANSGTLTVSDAGEYRVIMTSAHGCSDSSRAFTIIVNPLPVAHAGPDRQICLDDATIIGQPPTGGTPPFRHAWSPSTGLNAADIPSPSASPRVTTTYIVRVTDARGCASSDTVVVTVNPSPTPHVRGPVTACPNAVSLYWTAGNPGREYQWVAEGGAILTDSFNDSIRVHWGTAGIGRIIVTERIDTSGCTVSDTLLVAVESRLVPRITPEGIVVLCAGGAVTLDAGTGFASYRWTESGDTSVTLGRGQTLTVDRPGHYAVIVEVDGGCRGMDTAAVVLRTPTTPVIDAPMGTRLCGGDSITLVPRSVFRTQRWSTGDTTRTLVVRSPGTYAVTVVDSNGCQATSQPVMITIGARPRPVVTGLLTPCAQGAFDYTVQNPAGMTLTWTVVGGAVVSGQGGPVVRVQWGAVGSGSIAVLAVDAASGCDTTVLLPISINAGLTPKLEPAGPVSLCDGDTVTLGIPGGPFDSIRWSTGATTPTIAVTTSGSYSAHVTRGACAGDTPPVVVTFHPLPVPVILASGPLTLCDGDSVILTVQPPFAHVQWSTSPGDTLPHITVRRSGTHAVRVTTDAGCMGTASVDVRVEAPPAVDIEGPLSACRNGTAMYRIPHLTGFTTTWSAEGGSIVGDVAADSVLIHWGNGQTGAVECVLTGGSLPCSRTTRVEVTLSSTLAPGLWMDGLRIHGDTTITRCIGSHIHLRTERGYASHQWNASPVTDDSIEVIVAQGGGVHWVHVTSIDGCSGTSPTLTVLPGAPPVPVVRVVGATPLCPGDSVVLETTVDFAAQRWSTGDTTRSIVVHAAGRYDVEVWDATGCHGSSLPVDIVPAFPPSHIDGPASVCTQSTVRYRDTSTAAVGRRWSVLGDGTLLTADTDSTVLIRWGAVGAGSVQLVTTGITTPACSSTVVLSVSIGQTVMPEITVQGDTTLCVGATRVLCVEPGFVAHVWSTGDTSACITVSPVQPGRYTCTVTVLSDAGCTGTGSVTLTVLPLPEPRITALGPTTFCPGDSVLLDAGEGYISVRWFLDGHVMAGGRVITAHAAGAYAVQVTDANGCQAMSPPVDVALHAVTRPVITRDGMDLVTGPGRAYQWHRDGVPLPTGTGRRIAITAPGNYTVEVTDDNGCRAMSDPHAATAAAATVGLSCTVGGPHPSGAIIMFPIVLESSVMLSADRAREFHGVLRFNAGTLIPRFPPRSDRTEGRDRIIAFTGRRDSAMTQGVLTSLPFMVTLGDTVCTTVLLDSLTWADGMATMAPGVTACEVCVEVCHAGGTRLFHSEHRTMLWQNHPNPVSGTTLIEYEVVESGPVHLALYNTMGFQVMMLVDGVVDAGRYVVPCDAATLSSGLYMIVLRTATERHAALMEVVK